MLVKFNKLFCLLKISPLTSIPSFMFKYEADIISSILSRLINLKNLSLLRLHTQTSKAKSLVCDKANEHALTCTREACSCSQTAVQWNQYICIATVGNTIQTVNFPMYDTHMSTPGNIAKLGTAHRNIQIAQSNPSLVGSEPTLH